MIKRWMATAICLSMATAIAGTSVCKGQSQTASKASTQGDLDRLQLRINRLYAGIRPRLTPQARLRLEAQQRGWVEARNRDCADHGPLCQKQYQTRVDELESLSMTAQVANGKLSDVTPVMVLGKWKATGVQDPQGHGHTDPASVQASLADGDLPFVGGELNGSPGKLCVPPHACRNMGWSQTSLEYADGGAAIASALGLTPSTRVLMGNTGATSSPGLMAVPREDGSLWVVFGLCDANATNCRNAVETWVPVNADAAVSPRR